MSKVDLNEVATCLVQQLRGMPRIRADETHIDGFIKGRRVMVTGAGGTIGSALCRYLVVRGASVVVLFERHENSLYSVANSLERTRGCQIYPVIGDVTDQRGLQRTLAHATPEIVFHAAAHKHVPLLESNVCEAIKNNVVGTHLLARTAAAAGVRKVLVVSTDKAVSPSGIMGASKRISELVTMDQSITRRTAVIVVRLGNILGSSGSVLPTFIDQLGRRMPLTITHLGMRRYFLLLDEAIPLLCHTAASGKNGALYTVQMGRPIRVVDLAYGLIRAAGLTPNRDVKVVITGIRPGERLTERLCEPGEVLVRTDIPGVYEVTSARRRVVSYPNGALAALELSAARARGDDVIRWLKAILPTFRSGGAARLPSVRTPQVAKQMRSA